jgi:hypothetical protein
MKRRLALPVEIKEWSNIASIGFPRSPSRNVGSATEGMRFGEEDGGLESLTR